MPARPLHSTRYRSVPRATAAAAETAAGGGRHALRSAHPAHWRPPAWRPLAGSSVRSMAFQNETRLAFGAIANKPAEARTSPPEKQKTWRKICSMIGIVYVHTLPFLCSRLCLKLASGSYYRYSPVSTLYPVLSHEVLLASSNLPLGDHLPCGTRY